MISTVFRILPLLSVAFWRLAIATPVFPGLRIRNDQVTNQSYDFVVIGGGTAGLVVANRLSENENITVLVLEAGEIDLQEPFITIPALYGNFQELGTGPIGTHYDWNLTEVPQPGLLNRSRELPAAKVVGGGTVINGMEFLRGYDADYQRWEDLGNPGWNFGGLLKYFKKSETLNLPRPILSAWDIEFDPSVHGFDGPTQATFPPWVWPSTAELIGALKELNVSITKDDDAGNALGASWATLTQNPKTGTRWSARNGYGSVVRPNLHIMTGQHVTKILTEKKDGDDLVQVTGVEFAESPDSTRQIVSAKREVILSAGTFHDPQILLLSGIGNGQKLSSLGIDQVVDLPGVGYNYQDHPLIVVGHSIEIGISSLNFSNTTWKNEQLELFEQKGIGPFTSIGNNFLTFLPLSNFSNTSTASQIHEQAVSQVPDTYLPSDIDPTILAGYNLQHKILADELVSPDSAFMEFIYNDEVRLPGLQRAFSRGVITINTTDPFAPPVIDTRALSNPLDISLLITGIVFTRDIIATNAMAPLHPNETFPGSAISTDEGLEEYIKSTLTTLNHHVGTASMMPRELGGVVDSELKVHGTKGLRICDASIMPMTPATHLQAVVYAIGEKGADMIKASYTDT